MALLFAALLFSTGGAAIKVAHFTGWQIASLRSGIGRHSVLDWGILLYLGVFQIGIAYWFVSYAIARLSALETSVLLLLEPALNPVWSWLVLEEVPGAAPILGGILVLGATLARALWSEPQNSPEKRPGRLDRNAVATLE
jgi:drug/metabolite transporter (DMT)-like permease